MPVFLQGKHSHKINWFNISHPIFVAVFFAECYGRFFLSLIFGGIEELPWLYLDQNLLVDQKVGPVGSLSPVVIYIHYI